MHFLYFGSHLYRQALSLDTNCAPLVHTGQCKRTGGCYNTLVVAFYSTGGGVKGKKNLYLLTLLFIYKLAFILFVMTPGAQTTGNIVVYGSAKQLVI